MIVLKFILPRNHSAILFAGILPQLMLIDYAFPRLIPNCTKLNSSLGSLIACKNLLYIRAKNRYYFAP